MPSNYGGVKGLDQNQVMESRQKHGANRLAFKKQSGIYNLMVGLAKEPMVILLLVASAIYFISGDVADGLFLSFAIVLVSAISIYQASRSRNALEKLKEFTRPKCKVVREGRIDEIKTEDLVVGDALVADEGSLIAADGIIIHANDFFVNESILTGEALPVRKDAIAADHFIYSGTSVTSGLAIATVTAIGNDTSLGKIGKSLEAITEEKTPLEIQINSFVKKMVVVGIIVFVIVWGINFANSGMLLSSLLKALTLAMSILPEEIPVAFTTFMALGAWRLMKMGIVVKQMKTVETLGSATVICVDKTGTITQNKMSLAGLFVLSSGKISHINNPVAQDEKDLIRFAMWASEPLPFDPMEIALHEAYASSVPIDERVLFKLVHEYPLEGTPPMMTHVFEDGAGRRIIAAKGAPEAMIAVSILTPAQKELIVGAVNELAKGGYRILGVCKADFNGYDYPKTQQELKFTFQGLVAFYDPPKNNIHDVLAKFYRAGIEVKILTGDNATTTKAIAQQIGFRGAENSIDGSALVEMGSEELQKIVSSTNVFTRVFPDAKLKIIEALKAKQEIVAMTGDGVNDGPALKAAHIGIAMGKKGSSIAKKAASLILVEDDLAAMVDAIAMGRKIYTNLKKAIQYIISIHIPIILTVFIPVALGWVYPNIFSPVHIIFLELIMGPTCSIIYENEPMERDLMLQKPRPFLAVFFSAKELMTSIVQGIVITAGCLVAYRFAVSLGYSESLTRSVVFLVLISANVFLTLVNRSFHYSVLTTIRYKNNLVWLIISITAILTASLIYIPVFARFFQFSSLSFMQLLLAVSVGLVSVMWYEIVKLLNWKRYGVQSPTI